MIYPTGTIMFDHKIIYHHGCWALGMILFWQLLQNISIGNALFHMNGGFESLFLPSKKVVLDEYIIKHIYSHLPNIFKTPVVWSHGALPWGPGIMDGPCWDEHSQPKAHPFEYSMAVCVTKGISPEIILDNFFNILFSKRNYD